MAIESGGQDINLDLRGSPQNPEDQGIKKKVAKMKSGLKTTTNPNKASYLSPILASPTNSATKDPTPKEDVQVVTPKNLKNEPME
mmetsp:Transcript_1919/g.2724  ORF Transcript_1919/g.2724 Transcript_1919/m.2724 type:complete len:85 (+) Transcript_1919:3567-3821(+)